MGVALLILAAALFVGFFARSKDRREALRLRCRQEARDEVARLNADPLKCWYINQQRLNALRNLGLRP